MYMLKYLNQGEVLMHPPAKYTLVKGDDMFIAPRLQICRFFVLSGLPLLHKPVRMLV